jgi:hypothetical protein
MTRFVAWFLAELAAELLAEFMAGFGVAAMAASISLREQPQG